MLLWCTDEGERGAKVEVERGNTVLQETHLCGLLTVKLSLLAMPGDSTGPAQSLPAAE